MFYKTKLGFDRIGYKDYNYAVIGRENFVCHFWKCHDKIHPENTGCYVDVEQIEERYKELLEFDVIHSNGHLDNKPYACENLPFSIFMVTS